MPLQASDLHGLSLLAVDGVCGVTDLVEHLHHAILRPPGIRSVTSDARTGGIPRLVYRSIHGVTGLVGSGINLIARPLASRLPATASTPEREQFLAVLNGVLGDHLAREGNPIAIKSSFRVAGRSLALDSASLNQAFPAPSKRLLITAHGLCMHDGQWHSVRQPNDQVSHGDPRGLGFKGLPVRLAESCGYSTLDFHYNSGRQIYENGRELAELLEQLAAHWPVEIEELTILGHSMGGLVARSAAQHGTVAGHAWPARLKNIVSLGTPHLGSPVERAGHFIDRALGFSRYSAPFVRLGKLRSVGITDLRHGTVSRPEDTATTHGAESDEIGRPAGCPSQVKYFAVAATLDDSANSHKSTHIGDGLVPVPSALGQHENPQHRLPIPPENQFVATKTGHLELLRCPSVAQKVICWLE